MKFSFSSRVFLIIIILFFIRLGSGAQLTHAALTYNYEPLDNIRVDTTLDATQTYTVDGTTHVFTGATLTIPAGTHFIFTPGSQLIVDGNLVAKGTAAKHIVITGESLPVSIPMAQAFVVPALTVATPEVTETQTIDVAPAAMTPVVSNPMMMTDAASAPDSSWDYGIRFDTGSIDTLSYVDIQNAVTGITVDQGSTVTIAHTTFSDCDTGILGAGGTLHLTASTFTNVTYPADLDFHGTFTHSNNTFSNTLVAGWRYGGDVSSGETMKLNSTDGEYDIGSPAVAPGGSIVISPGVTIFVEDGGASDIAGLFSAKGTADSPITFHGNGACTTHSSNFFFDKTSTVIIGHAIFNDLCTGIVGSQSTLTLTNDSFNTIAGPAVTGIYGTTINASGITMNDVYQAFAMSDGSPLTLSDATISTVNSKDAAIEMIRQSPFSGNTVSIDTASICMDISDNSSMSAKDMTLTHCSVAGVRSVNNDDNGPSGISMTASEISQSGIALSLTNAQVTDVSNDKFHDDTIGVSLSDMPATTIINNWWGSNAGPTIASNPGGDGDSIVTKNVTSVTYKPWIGISSAKHNPVIIVPGITGSVLTKNYGDDNELWPNIAELALSPTDSFLNDLELLQDGTVSADRPITVGDAIRSAPGTDVFDGLIATLLQNGYKEGVDLFVMPYDWRLSNTVTQVQLKSVIANALSLSGKTKVNIIAHSMGGLVVKDYLAKNPTAPIDHLFFIGNPNLGAPKAFKALMYGDDMGYSFSLANALTINVLNADRIKTITQNMPSVYELLPSKQYIEKVGSYVAQAGAFLSGDDTISLMKTSGRNVAMFPFAQTLHDATDNLDLSKFSTYNFVGCGATKTIGKILLAKKESLTSTGMQLTDVYNLQYVAGDGTVPLASADAISTATNYFVNSGSHATLPSLAPVENAIAAILNDTVPKTTTGSGLATSTSSCALSGEIIEIHSPVTLDIYDDQGRHTGPTADGDIELGIPNVDYETIGDEKFAFLPDGQTYKIVNHAEAIGTYDMYIIRSNDDDTITNTVYFSDVPLTTTNATGTLTIGPDYDPTTTTPFIDMKENGDSDDDSFFYPVSISDQAASNDITPPVTTASVDKNDTVTLSAHDDVAGVLDTKYSIDGIHWEVYSWPFVASAGTTVQFLSRDREGNVENIKQIVIKASPSDSDTTQTPATPPLTVTDPQNTDQDTTPTTGNNYYYGGTTINEPSTTGTDSSDSSQANTNQSNSSDNSDNTNTDTPVTSQQTPDVKIPDVPTAATSSPDASQIDPTVLPSGETISDTATSMSDNGNLSGMYKSLSKKDSAIFPQANSLLASAANVIPLGNGTIVILLIIIYTVMIIMVTKRFLRKKSSDRQ